MHKTVDFIMTFARSISPWLAIVLILLLAAGMRMTGATYGYDDICLALPQEYWLYDKHQASSLYAPDVRTSSGSKLEDELITYPRERTAAVGTDVFLIVRLLGSLFGVLTVALVMRLGRLFKADWWLLAGLFVAVVPFLVESDRWIVQFDPAPLVVAVNFLALEMSYRNTRRPSNYHNAVVCLQIFSALSLFLVAPPLWWLAVVLVVLQPRPKWRFVLFLSVLGLLVIPALQSPLNWFDAASRWDVAGTGTVLLAVVTLALWGLRRTSYGTRFVMALLILAAGSVSVYQFLALPRLTEAQQSLVAWMHERIPDDAVVTFQNRAWDVVPVARCPMGNHLEFVAQPDDHRHNLPWDYIVATDTEGKLAQANYVTDMENGYYIGHQFDVPNPVDIPVGDLLHILSYELMTPSAGAGGIVHLRFDYQLSATANPDNLRYAAFIHVTRPNDHGEKLVDFNWPLIKEFSVFGPRVIVSHEHYRFNLPESISAGDYDILFGIYDVYSGERLPVLDGDTLFVEQLSVPE